MKDTETNRRLCESRTPIAVRELFAIDAKTIKPIPRDEARRILKDCRRQTERGPRPELRESDSGDGLDECMYEAKVGQAAKKNQNDRVYPRQVWQDQIDKYAPLLKDGYLCGAVDHLGYGDGGNLRDTCIIHRELRMESDGAIISKFQVVQKHSRGADLKANIDAGMAVGFSTFGYGTSHAPGEGERAEFGLSLDDYDAVVMNRDYDLRKIDAVDDPSVADARVEASETTDEEDDGPTPLAEAFEPESRGEPSPLSGTFLRESPDTSPLADAFKQFESDGPSPLAESFGRRRTALVT